MAYVKILNISCSSGYLKAAVDYAVSPDKTIEERLNIANEYAINTDKTELDEVRYASCLNLTSVDTAAQEMLETKEMFHKTGGRLGYHVIQSFSPDDNITPEQAHQIGLQYAKELFGDYEVVIGTHVDRAHIHNHIVINSVSYKTGEKLHFEKGYLHRVLRAVSDRYCKEQGLSTIAYTKNYEMAAQKWYDRHWKKGSFKESINRDIRRACEMSSSVPEMLVVLENMGYTTDSSKKHITVKPPDGAKAWRLDKFYTKEEYELMTSGAVEKFKARKACKMIGTAKVQRTPRKLTSFEHTYLYWLKILGVRNSSRRYIPFSEVRRTYQYQRQLRFAAGRSLTKLSEVIALRERTEERRKELNRERYRLKGRKQKFSKLFNAAKQVARRQSIESELLDILPKEEREKYDRALRLIDKSGYTLDEITQLRIGLEGEIMENKAAANEAWNDICMCRNIEKDTEKMRSGVRHYVKSVAQERKERSYIIGRERNKEQHSIER